MSSFLLMTIVFRKEKKKKRLKMSSVNWWSYLDEKKTELIEYCFIDWILFYNCIVIYMKEKEDRENRNKVVQHREENGRCEKLLISYYNKP